ncbi:MULTISPECIES: type II secretion system minor pseudopilin GspK [unclassified Sphingobium]|uniref:type II secretion system minor pseudopilin GspK n=1 Tax=unclassified Sphingobium TaxID=2611147 RepID=UPI000D16D11A|nr:MULTISPECIES: type II secretion system minor pseudopilin GspK [unclassified Sphingobium]MBG6116972.1 general secretion pathway protein K [Sphingobium sp. JAI105]PSO11511.1 general secretion pathway protein GspK [Sphingobium sp. AEW4]TWD12820.1 general secretion pathway protein K [Sphingobium sp. AEW010]TWD30591.1 general secretion pathway protein K [Sphingobium sp. AEW013]TWD30654.1 general secretion pathway protein K [Sphingobium sp. AEW001]
MPDPRKPNEQGAALLTVLLLVAVMAVVAATALERVALATRMTGNGGAIDQARAYAEAGTAVARLRIGDLVAANPAKMTLAGGWLGAPQSIPVPGGIATARVNDGGNCFNLNSVVSGESEASLKARPIGVSQFQALLVALGVDARQAQGAAASLADWIDSDGDPQPGGAEDAVYGQMARPYRAANRLMVDASELRAVNGITPAIYATVRPWICALPVTDLSPININTLLPEQAPLFAMLLPGQLSVGQARQLLAQRPADGYGSTNQFWALPSLAGLSPMTEVAEQVKLTTGFFGVDVAVTVGGTQLVERSLIDARESPAIVVRRSWGAGA